MMPELILIFFGYLLGAVPFGVLIAKFFYHVDIRQHGSRNTGATNVWRMLGKKPGMGTLALDILKGAIPVIIAHRFFFDRPLMAIFAGLASIIGHNWSIFLMGSGGKGVATSAGVFLALLPLEGVIALVVFGIFFFSTRHVSVGSMAGALALLTATLVRDTPNTIRVFVVVAAAMIVIKHVPNMKRLVKGEEPKVQFK